MLMRIKFFVFILVSLLFSLSSLQARDFSSGVAQVTIDQAIKEYGLPPTLAVKLSNSVTTLPLLEQNEYFLELAEQYSVLSSQQSLSAKLKQALSQGNFSAATDLLPKPATSQPKKLATYYYQYSLIESLRLDNDHAQQLAEKTLQFDVNNSRYQRHIAQLLILKKKTRLAIQYLERALQLDLNQPNNKTENLAKDHELLGRLWYLLASGKKAAEHFQQAVLLTKDSNARQLADAYFGLALVSQNSGDTTAAIASYEKALKTYHLHFGDVHPSIANTQFQLATAWKTQGKKEKAIAFLKQSLATNREAFGVKSLVYARKLNTVGATYRLLGEYDQALRLHQQALQINHSSNAKVADIAKNYSLLAAVYKDKKNTKQSISYYEKSLQSVREAYGKAHPMVALSYGDLASAWLKAGDTEKALENYKQALSITQHNYGNKHREIARLLRNIGITWQLKGDYKKATKYFEQALHIAQAIYGNNTPQVTQYMDKLGYALNQLGQSAKAESYHQQALLIDKKAYGEKNVAVARDYSHLGSAIAKQGKTDQALKLHQQALAIDLLVSGGSHPNTARDLSNLGREYKQLGKLKESVSSQEKALRIDRMTLGEHHKNIAIQENNLGVDFYRLGKDKQAKKHLSKAVELAGGKHPNRSKIKKNMEKFEADISDEARPTKQQ